MRQNIQFFLNGRLVALAGEQVFWPLSRYLRESQRLVGTKIVCAEGDCGACSVLVGRRDHRVQQRSSALQYRAIDSCIVFMHQLDRTSIVTVEGLAGDKGELTPIQQSMVDGHGSQCGFCTPGFVVTMHGIDERCRQEKNEQCGQGGQTLPGGDLDNETLQVELSGNLCRCTGYVQILRAARAAIGRGQGINDRYPPEKMIEHFGALGDDPVSIQIGDGRDRKRVFVAANVSQALAFRAEHPTCRVVSGATDVGVQHNHGKTIGAVLLGIADVPELTTINADDQAIRFGAAATWTDVLPVVQDHFPGFDAILLRFGSPQIRNIGSIGGNLANGSPIADSIPFFMAAGAEIELASLRGRRLVPMKDFYIDYKRSIMADDELITAIVVPRLSADSHLNLYKVSRRRDMDISTLTAGIHIGRRDGLMHDVRIAIGGAGPVVMRCAAAESRLEGLPWTEPNFEAAAQVIVEDIAPMTDVRGTDKFRYQLAGSLIRKCYHDLTGDTSAATHPVVQ